METLETVLLEKILQELRSVRMSLSGATPIYEREQSYKYKIAFTEEEDDQF